MIKTKLITTKTRQYPINGCGLRIPLPTTFKKKNLSKDKFSF
jgi:hypothetical protein